ncbi:50S ribosomal protein L11 methyltransferase [bacterium]|nr:50S ribosomal protein L11 methyltransferase [bacterium]
MKWYEIIVSTTSEGTELIADAFFSIGCLGGVKIIDKNDVLDIIKNQQMWDYIDENLLKKSETAFVSGFVSEEEKDQKIKELTDFLDARKLSYCEINTMLIDDESWYESWKRYYKPIIAGKYVIVPKWLNYSDDDSLIKVLMDPGMAFGTGEHESTKMCLMLLSEVKVKGKSVIDVGTGSGILGIAAIKSGASSCYMCDIDCVAVKAAKENASLNGVENSVAIELNDLLSDKSKKADVVLANLTADILIRLSDGLKDHINNQGKLICSGIIHSRKEEVIATYKKAGFTLEKETTMGEWNALLFGV